MSGGPCNLNKGEVYLGQLPNNRFEVILFETSHPILTSSLLRKRWKQSIRECLYLENAVTQQNLLCNDLVLQPSFHNRCKCSNLAQPTKISIKKLLKKHFRYFFNKEIWGFFYQSVEGCTRIATFTSPFYCYKKLLQSALKNCLELLQNFFLKQGLLVYLYRLQKNLHWPKNPSSLNKNLLCGVAQSFLQLHKKVRKLLDVFYIDNLFF